MMKKIECPKCGESWYIEKYSTRTAMYYPLMWKDGVNVNPDGNITMHVCECLNCGYNFNYQERYGDVWNGYDS